MDSGPASAYDPNAGAAFHEFADTSAIGAAL